MFLCMTTLVIGINDIYVGTIELSKKSKILVKQRSLIKSRVLKALDLGNTLEIHKQGIYK